ncbi:SagB/ThcOx family dehydrogenase [Alcaligenaceae bacterium]|nr:SagB/ThcOx family dehydrogenase [Alcaligenaceae bacterium]
MSKVTLSQVLSQRRTVRNYSDASIPLDVVKRLIWAGQGITGSDGKRTAPSAHAIHPLRLYFLVNRVVGLEKGLYEVDLSDHGLKQLSGADLYPALTKAAIGNPQCIMDAACIIVICADLLTPIQAFADQKPFGSRGVRYVYLEAGAAAQNLQLQAVAEGLGSVWVGGFDDETTANVLGLRGPLAPIIQLCVGYPASTE